MTLVVVRHAERPELWDRIPERFAGVVPEYNLHGDINGDYWNRLFEDFPEFQFVLYDDEQDVIVGAGRSLPRSWDGTAADLGPGLDDSIARAFADRDAGRAPGALCALGIEVAEDHQGRGLSKVLLDAMSDTARRAGLGTVLVPVRPTWKERYPLVPIERYAAWTRDDGAPFDPWIRTQVGAGGTVAAASDRSSRITGTVAEWESWTGLAFPEDGQYVFPGGLAPLDVDRARDLGAYWEPGVWITHRVGAGPDPS
ncbi:GNAT family N-acetyltransferase [Streptomyces sp. NBC_00378]|uniref:GNAT family N-acetyltransferase n=1 Tax=unclassified Streptomyces TaxID=2593676 RepID=UPI00225026C7|nr:MULTISPECIES: GNAT family N-acetyltransferase [unclassified Streptomyces]MCX5112718.1 GNAT family N-acetyltransferase [Streptomyces sp. NBC_00378]